MAENKPDLDAAYALKTPEDSVRLYRDWAGSYDTDFAARLDYRLPEATAAAFAEGGGAGPVLDVGAGTGLLGAALRERGIGPVDGLDISSEMLEAAAQKGDYRRLVQADLTRALPLDHGAYAGITSSGTFTHGHVGPEALEGLMQIAAPGALFALSIKVEIYETMGFAETFAAMGPRIAGLELLDCAVYGPGADADHAAHKALIARFRKV